MMKLDTFKSVHNTLQKSRTSGKITFVRNTQMKDSQLCEPVQIALKNSEASLREALSFASKSEDPMINLAISQLIYGVNQILMFSQTSHFHIQKF